MVPARDGADGRDDAQRRSAEEDAEGQRVDDHDVARLHRGDAFTCREAREGLHHEGGEGKERAGDEAAAEGGGEGGGAEELLEAGHIAVLLYGRAHPIASEWLGMPETNDATAGTRRARSV